MKRPQSVLVPCACILLASLTGACKKGVTAASIDSAPAAIVQKGHAGTSTWVVAPDGAVSATLKGPDGKPVTKAVAGDVTFTPPNAPPTSVPVQYDPATGVLTAAGPKLDADITPVNYRLAVDGKPWNGSLDVPRGGTLDLVETGKLQAAAPLPPVGPNGGVVQVVGPDRVEVVANKSNGDVRAYVLDPQNQVIDPGDRKITIALQGEAPEVVALEPAPEARFFVGHLRTRVDPPHVTVAVNVHGATHACLMGWAPGTVIVAGPEAPRVHLLAVEEWPGEVVELHGRHHHRGEVVVGAPGVVVEGPSVTVAAPGLVVAPPSFGVSVGIGGEVVAPGVAVEGRGGFHEHGHEHGDGDHDRGRHHGR